MKLSEIQSHNISHRINVPFPVKWSEDDVIATATEKGVQILEVIYNPNNKIATIDCHRYYVDANENKPTSLVGINTSSLFMKADTSDAVNLVLDHDLAPELGRTTSLQSVVKQIDWCPNKEVQSFRRCILACVTNAGQVSLIGFKFTSWVEVLDLSKIWVRHCKKKWGIISTSTKHQLSELKYRTSRVKATAITWVKGKSTEKNTSILIMAFQDGIITIWKIFNAMSVESNDSVDDMKGTTEISAEVINSFDSKMTHITNIYWHGVSDAGYLIVSNSDGLLSYIKGVQINEDNVNVLKEDIWNVSDKVPVTDITSWNYGTGFLCVFVKGSFIVIAYIDINEGKVLSISYHNTGMRFVSGLQRVDENSLLVSSRNNRFSLLNLVCDDNTSNIIVQENEIECSFVRNRYALHGFALSRNKVLGAALLSVSGAFDHIVIREPTCLLFFSLSEINEPLEKMLSSNFEQINDVWDCFDVVRWQILNKIITYALPENLESALDTMELKQLIITMWLTKFLTTAAEIDEFEEGDEVINKEKSASLINTFEEIEELVFSCNVFKRCANLITNITNLTSFDKESLALMRKWLDHLIMSLPENHITTRSSASTLLEEINVLVNNHSIILPQIEKCCICNDEVPCLTGFKTSRCPRGHVSVRCSLSLVQVSYNKSYRCTRCNAVAHELAVSGESTNCIFCNNTLRIDGRLLEIPDDEIIDEAALREEISKLLSKK